MCLHDFCEFPAKQTMAADPTQRIATKVAEDVLREFDMTGVSAGPAGFNPFQPVPPVANGFMPVFMNVPMMVPVPVHVPSVAKSGGKKLRVANAPKQKPPQKSVKPPQQSVNRSEFERCPREHFEIRNTFIHVDEAPAAKAKRRSPSCPAVMVRTSHPRTTVCVRNLPNRTQPSRLEVHVKNLGFECEAVHMPLDRKTGVNKGYAFIKFLTEEEASEFIGAVEGTQIQGSHSSKRLVGGFAARQGPSFHMYMPAQTPSSPSSRTESC